MILGKYAMPASEPMSGRPLPHAPPFLPVELSATMGPHSHPPCSNRAHQQDHAEIQVEPGNQVV